MQKLTLWQAVLININIMFGSGIFINTVQLIKIAGIFSFMSYLSVAIILFPLIFSMMSLIRHYPTGGFYIYAAKEFSPFLGFLSAWAYFIGKLASASLLIHVFSLLIQTIITPLLQVNLFFIDFSILALFMWLNYFGIKTGTRITYIFIICKIMPIVSAILMGLYLFTHWSIPPEMLAYTEIPTTIPLVLYAFVGFEAACSLSLAIQNPEKNAPRAVLYSFLFTITITIIYQLITALAIGPILLVKNTFLDIFPTYFTHFILEKNVYVQHAINLFHIAGATSALGGSFGMIFSNSWNLFILAEHKHIFLPQLFTKKNSYGVPFACILAEGFICICYYFFTTANQIILQQMSVLGCSIAFIISTIALLKISAKQNYKDKIIPWLGFISSLLLLAMCIRNFVYYNPYYLILFCTILLLGSIMFFIQTLREKQQISAP